MDIPEAKILSFIVKIWLEETTMEAGENKWRGHITHVPSGKRRYIQHVDEITAFIAPYLEEVDARGAAAGGAYLGPQRYGCREISRDPR